VLGLRDRDEVAPADGAEASNPRRGGGASAVGDHMDLNTDGTGKTHSSLRISLWWPHQVHKAVQLTVRPGLSVIS
jgi:hypothetical protein